MSRAENEPTLDQNSATRPGTPSSTQSGDATSAPTSLTRVGSTLSATLVSPIQALHNEEIRRTRVFSWLAAAFAGAVALVLPFTDSHPTTLAVMLSGFAAYLPAAIYLHKKLEHAREVPVGAAMVFGYASLFASTCGTYYFGLFSPAPAAMAFGIFFFSPSTSFRAALAIYLGGATMHALLSIALISGLVVDRGIVRAEHLSLAEQVFIQALVELVFLASFVVGRITRSATLGAIIAHDRAVEELAQREDLLKEARIELVEAQGAGRLGHYSDQEVGAFVLGEVIGRGAMGEVYDAAHVTTGEPAAVKLLHRHALSHPRYLRRFIREAKTAASLDSPHVAKVLEIGGLDAPIPYIAMERLQGEDLADLLRKRPRLSMRDVVRLVEQVGAGLDAARSAGVVHRDINPRNLFAAETSAGKTWKILDFGVAKALDQALSFTGDDVVGTPAYMAPELAMGKPITPLADLFSLAAVAYRALTGHAPFSGTGVPETLMHVVHGMPPKPSELVRLSAEVDAVFAIALAKKPEDRFQTAAELAQALASAARGKLEEDLSDRAERLLGATPWRTKVA